MTVFRRRGKHAEGSWSRRSRALGSTRDEVEEVPTFVKDRNDEDLGYNGVADGGGNDSEGRMVAEIEGGTAIV